MHIKSSTLENICKKTIKSLENFNYQNTLKKLWS